MTKTSSLLPALCGLLCALTLPAQPVHAVWPLGTNEFPDNVPGYGNLLLRFEPGVVKPIAASLHMNFESTAAAVADSLGSPIFYTNGCYIADAQGDTMPGSTAFAVRKDPKRLTRTTRSKSENGISWVFRAEIPVMPALFTRTSTRPHTFISVATATFTEVSSVTSTLAS